MPENNKPNFRSNLMHFDGQDVIFKGILSDYKVEKIHSMNHRDNKKSIFRIVVTDVNVFDKYNQPLTQVDHAWVQFSGLPQGFVAYFIENKLGKEIKLSGTVENYVKRRQKNRAISSDFSNDGKVSWGFHNAKIPEIKISDFSEYFGADNTNIERAEYEEKFSLYESITEIEDIMYNEDDGLASWFNIAQVLNDNKALADKVGFSFAKIDQSSIGPIFIDSYFKSLKTHLDYELPENFVKDKNIHLVRNGYIYQDGLFKPIREPLFVSEKFGKKATEAGLGVFEMNVLNRNDDKKIHLAQAKYISNFEEFENEHPEMIADVFTTNLYTRLEPISAELSEYFARDEDVDIDSDNKSDHIYRLGDTDWRTIAYRKIFDKIK